MARALTERFLWGLLAVALTGCVEGRWVKHGVPAHDADQAYALCRAQADPHDGDRALADCMAHHGYTFRKD